MGGWRAALAHLLLNSLAVDLLKDAVKFLVGAAAGWALKVGRDRWRSRRARAFWRPFLTDDLCIVVGRFQKEFKDFERSGFLGAGDAVALAELQHYLAKIGAPEPQLFYADQLQGDSLKHTMISLGGPDANAVTREAAKLIGSTLRFGDPSGHEISILDTAANPPRHFSPQPLDRDGSGTDYGVILRAPSPFAPGKQIMIVAGSFGHGTWAGTRFVTSPAFLALPQSRAQHALECLVKTDVVGDTPQRIQLEVVRSIETETLLPPPDAASRKKKRPTPRGRRSGRGRASN